MTVCHHDAGGVTDESQKWTKKANAEASPSRPIQDAETKVKTKTFMQQRIAYMLAGQNGYDEFVVVSSVQHGLGGSCQVRDASCSCAPHPTKELRMRCSFALSAS